MNKRQLSLKHCPQLPTTQFKNCVVGSSGAVRSMIQRVLYCRNMPCTLRKLHVLFHLLRPDSAFTAKPLVYAGKLQLGFDATKKK